MNTCSGEKFFQKTLDNQYKVCYNTYVNDKALAKENTMAKHEIFNTEIELIESEDLRDFVRYFFDECCGDWFFEEGASSSGKYHPKFSQGKGGLVRHVKGAFMFLEELLRLSSWAYLNDEYKDYARVAILLHDCRKYGAIEYDKSCYPMHGQLCADAIEDAWHEMFQTSAPELLKMAVRSHMGQWTEDREDRPFTPLDRLVHLADYLSSRSFLDIPALSADLP